MPVLAAVGERESPGIGEPAGGAVHDLGHHGQRTHGPRAHSGRQQQFGKILRSTVGRGGQIAVQPSRDDVFGANIVVRRHYEMRQQGCTSTCVLGSATFQPRELAHDPVRAREESRSSCAQRDVSARRSARLTISPCPAPSIAACGSSTKLCQPFRQPMIATRLLALPVHALLHHRPVAVIGDDETVQIEIETVLHGGAVDLGHEPARLRELAAVEADAGPR